MNNSIFKKKLKGSLLAMTASLLASSGAQAAFNAFSLTQAESYSAMKGISIFGAAIGSFDAGDYVAYKAVSFGTGANQLTLNIGVPQTYAGKQVEVRIDSLNGPKVGTLTVQATNGWADYRAQKVAISVVSGTHDLYLIARGGYGVGNLDSFLFTNTNTTTTTTTTLPPATTTTTLPTVTTTTLPPTTTTTTVPPVSGGGAIDPNAVVIAPNGSDSNQCTASAPCATLERAQAVVRASSVKTVYLRAGTYRRTQMLTLTSADNGEVWTIHPSDPMNSAILDATGSVFSHCTNSNLILIQGGSNITINGLQFQNFVFGGGVTIHGGQTYPKYSIDGCYSYPATTSARGNIVSNNIIHDMGSGANNAYPWGWFSGVVTMGDTQATIVKNNTIFNMGGPGIAFHVFETGPSNGLSNSVMSNNMVYNTNTDPDSGDMGGLYVIDRTGTSTGVRIENNILRDYGSPSKSQKGIYLDDNTSYISVKGNVIAGQGTFHAMIHGGHDNIFAYNVFDVGVGGKWAMLYQNGGSSTAMSGNQIVSNIVIGKYTGTGNFNGDVWKTGYSPNGFTYPKVANNIYWNYEPTGGALPNQGDIKDSSPVTVNPQLSGWAYNLSSTSPAYSAPVNLLRPATWGQPGFFGPIGYTVLAVGTAPSSPH